MNEKIEQKFNEYKDIKNLFLDKVGSIEVRDTLVSDGGTVINLEKDAPYVCEWYTGTFYQDYEMIANIHPFCVLENFTTYDYNFLHSSCMSISIPSWLKTGYYYINGIGLFRYVKGNDSRSYNGEAYDSTIEWNDPIIIKNERGEVIYNPSTGYKDTIHYSDSTVTTNDNAASTINYSTNGTNQGNSGYDPSEVGTLQYY